MGKMNSKAFRTKVGLDALSSKGETIEQIAGLYEITREDVVLCRQEAAPIHKRLVLMQGPAYFTNAGMRGKPESLFGLFWVGPSELFK